MAARHNTRARSLRAARSESPRTPISEPIHAPNPAVRSQIQSPSGSDPARDDTTAIPTIEFTNVKRADVPAAFRALVQPLKTKTGLRKIPPPIPVKPEINPITAPVTTKCKMFECTTSVVSDCLIKPDDLTNRSEA